MADFFSRMFFTWFLMSLGLWKLSEKMNWEKRWMAWIPGLRYYAFADSMDMRAEGMGCGVLEILYFLMSISPFAFEDSTKLVIAALISLAIVIALYVYRIRIFMRMILLFDLKRRWLICWLIAEWLTVLVLGFGRKYQPHPEVSFQAGWEAGMEPAQISGVSAAMNATTASRNGLSVLLRERTVRELGKKKYLLKDIAMNIPNGSLVLLLGGSGAGKTTFMNAVIGYEKADADIYLNGTNVYKQYGQMKYKIGFVTQTNLVRTHDTVFRTISDAAKLLDFGFANYTMYTPDIPEEAVTEIAVKSGMSDTVGTVSSAGDKILIKKGSESGITPEVILPSEIDAPVDKGAVIGKVIYKSGGKQIAECPVTAEEGVRRINFGDIFGIFARALI